MNTKLFQLIPFGSKRTHWYERPFNGNDMKWMWSTLGGLAFGAGLMYILDPDRGRSRRAIARDKITSTVNRTSEAISEKSRDLMNRASGIVDETGSLFRGGKAS
ncbi:MAG: hypothetical protein L0226_12715 [Acidobacteria bacterium]|nr:hypothetical protein [Acidobacteriota bacterium]